MKPEPQFTQAELRQRSLDVMRAAPFPMMATVAGSQPAVRPVSPVRTDGFTVYVASLRSSGKTAELEANDQVELCYLTPDHDQVRISGVAELVLDSGVRQEIWDASPLLRAYLKTIDNPEFILYRVVPRRVRFMREWALTYHEVGFQDE